MPLSVVSIALSVVIIHRLWGRGIGKFLALLLSCALVVALLGLDVSFLGRVEFDSQGWVLVLHMYALTLLLNVVYLATFAALERNVFRGGGGASAIRPAAAEHPAHSSAQR